MLLFCLSFAVNYEFNEAGVFILSTYMSETITCLPHAWYPPSISWMKKHMCAGRNGLMSPPPNYQFSSKYIFRGICPILAFPLLHFHYPLHSSAEHSRVNPYSKGVPWEVWVCPQAIEAASSAHSSPLLSSTPFCPPYFDGPEDHDLLIFMYSKVLSLVNTYRSEHFIQILQWSVIEMNTLFKSSYFSPELHSKHGNLCLLLLPLLVRGEPHCHDLCTEKPWGSYHKNAT